jgi:hypothetical protein
VSGASSAVIAGVIVLGVGVIAYMLIKAQQQNNIISAVGDVLGGL